MQYLIRLIAPKGATVLDIFMGSGSTGKAAMIENVERDANYYFIGIDLTEEYMPIAEARIEFGRNYATEKPKADGIVHQEQIDLFSLL
jgi:site-specific DNA-methyltransferase (adenine-specific)